MEKQLKQFVPSHVCLKCDGCCQFHSPDTIWRPKWDKKDFTDDQDYITTIKDCGAHLCRFFNKGDHTCGIYQERPFECALYPFVLSKNNGGVDVLVHLACPYVQDHQAAASLQEYIDYLKGFFQDGQIQQFLKRNTRLIHDYAPVSQELQYLFTIEGLSL